MKEESTAMNTVSRRSFIRNAGGATVALWLGMSSDGLTSKTTDVSTAKNFTPYILVESNGTITLFNMRPEMGQGTFQSIPALIAEEFEVSLDKVVIKFTNGEKEFGNMQSAGGSRSVVTSYASMRNAGASAREVFIQAAASKWKVDPAECYANDGKIIHHVSGKSFTYGELVDEASKLELPKEPKLKDKKDFKILGKSASRPDVKLKTNGSAEFGIDVEVPGMLYASVERCPVIGGTLKSFDASEALKMPGIVSVVDVSRVFGRYEYVGVAVVGRSYWEVTQARKKLKIEWDTRGFETFNTLEYEDVLRNLANEDGLPVKVTGDVNSLDLKPENIVDAFYETPMVAHHPMEPMNCIAHVQGDKVEVWTSTQVPNSIKGSNATDLGKVTGFAPENITLHTSFVGGGFGRRLNIDYVIEAVNLAKKIDHPVKVIWSREDTTRVGPYRSMTFSKMKGGFSDEGKLVMYQHKVIGPTHREALSPTYDKSKADGALSEGIGEQAYEIPNLDTRVVRADFHVPLAAWRSVISATTAFAHECFIDEMAYKAKAEPYDFRLSLLTKASDTKRVLEKLRAFSNWDKPLAKGKGRGVAVWEFFAGLCAQVVEVTYNGDKTVRIDKVYAAIDLGEVVNPDNVKNQVEGAIVMALGAAVKPEITMKDGEVMQHNFYDSPLIRINEVPEIEVLILTNGGKMKGVGEPGLPPFAPALANAIFAATGKRIRKMPLDLRNI
ncbi:MAG: molybdopterin cofactor-binding domain-containing protein [Bacteroidota bacterium]